MRRKWVIFTMLLTALSLGAFFTFSEPTEPFYEAKIIGQGAQGFEELKKRFQDLAHDKGAPYAFQVLLRAPLPPDTDLHLLGHAVGDILYEQEGTAAIAKCTHDFRNACSHSLVVGALLDYGEGALPEIRKACENAPGGSGAYTMCYHGLGHGVFSFFNYEIPATVEMCMKTGTKEYNEQEAKQCIGGAIMELMGGGDHDKEGWEISRKKYLTEPLAPCDSAMIPANLKFFCYSYLTPRLLELAGLPPTGFGEHVEKLPKAFSYCEKVPERENRKICNEGFGKEFVPLAGERDIRAVDQFSDAQLSRVIEWCQYGRTKEAKADCVNGALHSLFWGGENDPRASARLCALASDNLKDSCYKTFIIDTRYYVRDREQRARNCALVPQEYTDVCLQ